VEPVSPPTATPFIATPIPPAPTVAPTGTMPPPTAVPPTATSSAGGSDPGPVSPAATATPTPAATPTPTVTLPEVALDLTVPGGSSVSLVPIFSGTLQMGAGDSVVRTLSVQNNGARTFRYYLNTSGGAGPLWTDPTNGLQMVITRNGTEVYRGSLSMPDQLLGELARGGQDSLVLTVSLPATAGNTFQGLSTTIAFNFTAVTVP
jgi:hypothetical protein